MIVHTVTKDAANPFLSLVSASQGLGESKIRARITTHAITQHHSPIPPTTERSLALRLEGWGREGASVTEGFVDSCSTWSAL